MAMGLFRHNQSAYGAAVIMLAESGKAAVIQPDGTGKSSIGFQLCEDNPDKRILWLSPSDFRFRIQLENWSAAGGKPLHNILPITCASLSALSEKALSQLQPDILVLYDYCRENAAEWSEGVRRLQALYPEVPVLGLFAARGEMTEWLFDRSSMIEMTLGEAIVRGILKPPRYILSYLADAGEPDLERYERRVSAMQSKTVRVKADACLKMLRGTLQNAAQPAAVLERYLPDHRGKYLVFAPDTASVRQYAALAETWFWNLDRQMHVYPAENEDLFLDESFRAFREDTSDHLRLLYCTDALLADIRLEQISGVILLRPSGAAADFRQQIGRAVFASCSEHPVILDLVSSPEQLYSMDSVMEEMRDAVAFCRSHEEEQYVVHESLEIMDTAIECKALLEQLEEKLAASWDVMYSYAEQYSRENGSLQMPKDYRTQEGYSLWSWLAVQRRIRSGAIQGTLTDEQIEKLDKIGMHWDTAKDIAWNKYFSAAKTYFDTMHNLTPPVAYVTEDGVQLGTWLAQLRASRKIGLNSSYLTPEHIAQLDKIGMVWGSYDFVFERNYHVAANYYRQHGDLNCKQDYVDSEGFKLGMWLNTLRQQYKKHGRGILTDEQFRMLDSIGMCWGNKYDQQWEEYFHVLIAYVKRTGSTNVPTTWNENGVKIGRWLRQQKDLYMKGSLRTDRAEKLQSLGIDLVVEDLWETKYKLAKAYSETHGGQLNVPHDYIANGVWLNKWLHEQKLAGEGKRHRKLTEEQRRKLEAIGMVFGSSNKDTAWEQHFQAVKNYVEQAGNTMIPRTLCDADGTKLRNWVSRQKDAARKSILPEDKIQKLRDIGFSLESADSFETGFEHARTYFDAHGNLAVPDGFVCDDGFPLAQWLHHRRTDRKALSPQQIARLDALGMVWDAYALRWHQMYQEALLFHSRNGNLKVPPKYKSSNGKELYGWLLRQRKLYRQGKLDPKQIRLLQALGFRFDSQSAGGIRSKAERKYSDSKHT